MKFDDFVNDYILYIGNECWHNEACREQNDLVSTSSKLENESCNQNQNIFDLKQKHHTTDNLTKNMKNTKITLWNDC